ncbi:MAG: hypothetical protein D6767_06110 [Candidatus Hydrogenedentota bacterium]|nr:MAG: hypothetical protein D6767_06110 [Candidatus Hydrogenedentota bacterium]
MLQANKEEPEKLLRKLAEETLRPGFAIYDMQVSYTKNNVRILVYLDKLIDPNGSPTIEDCEEYTHLFRLKLEALQDARYSEAAIDVSSPGAEREIRSEEDLIRFADKPMAVRYYEEDGTEKKSVFNFIEKTSTGYRWKEAVLKRGNTKKKARGEKIIPPEKIRDIHLYLDF